MDNPSFHLEGVVREKDEMQDFEGPLSLILMLLSKNKIEIRDIKISEILDQYLEYLAEMESMDLEIASEFIQMASHLLYINTKTLLTSEEEVSECLLILEPGVYNLVWDNSYSILRSKTIVYSVRVEAPPPTMEERHKGAL